MSSKSPKSLIKGFTSSNVPRNNPQSTQQILKEFPRDERNSSASGESHQEVNDTKSVIRSFMAFKSSPDDNSSQKEMTAADEQFCRVTHDKLLRHPALKDSFAKIIDNVLCLANESTMLCDDRYSTESFHCIDILEDESMKHTSTIDITCSNSSDTSTSRESESDLTPAEGQRHQLGTPLSDTFSDSSIPIPVAPSASNPAAPGLPQEPLSPPEEHSKDTYQTDRDEQRLRRAHTWTQTQKPQAARTLFTCEASRAFHGQLLRHPSLEKCAPRIVDGVLTLQDPLTNHYHNPQLVLPTSALSMEGNGCCPTTVNPPPIIDVSMSPQEKEVLQQYMRTCVMIETGVISMGLLLKALVAVSVVVLCLLFAEGWGGIRNINDLLHGWEM